MWAAKRKHDGTRMNDTKQKTIEDQLRLKLLSLKDELKEHQAQAQ